jgi:hypothetical protein
MHYVVYTNLHTHTYLPSFAPSPINKTTPAVIMIAFTDKNIHTYTNIYMHTLSICIYVYIYKYTHTYILHTYLPSFAPPPINKATPAVIIITLTYLRKAYFLPKDDNDDVPLFI